ncbi:hypothetical protein NSA56_01945 [Oceanobacillus caeni]|uniref:hypothetical protein n=1 Tax=Oceanobacillus caeni TaxID=405946 RepID=UPI002149AC95|nr:hypothetical protein [Oceanobacillus caeni]MCR1833159.1 hypothetical protein [Oceanobacillus caeni]
MQKQVYIYSLPSDAFYTTLERKLDNKKMKLHRIEDSERNNIKKLKQMLKCNKDILAKELENDTNVDGDEIKYVNWKINRIENLIERKQNRLSGIHKYKNQLKQVMSNRNKANRIKRLLERSNARVRVLNKMLSLFETTEIRKLNQSAIKESNKVSIFDSVLTRTLGIEENDLTDDVIVVNVYYIEILEDLIHSGFVNESGEKYIYFVSSASQIRNNKAMFIKESVWNKHKGSLMCGLSDEVINSKGGINQTKYQAYKSLSTTASVEWTDFNIDEVIVVDDLVTNVKDDVDYINRDTYKIDRIEDKELEFESTDGVGMILPDVAKGKNFQIRLPWIKGLLASYNFLEQAKTYGNTKVTDIWDREWDIEKDNIKIILTKSQMKMSNYYKSWEEYKQYFKDNNCQAAILNIEDDKEDIPDSRLNYQYLQSLVDVSDKELKELASDSIEEILKLGRDKDVMLDVMGAVEGNKNKNNFQKALYMYPELLRDPHAKETIKSKKDSLIKKAKAGKLKIKGKYTYIIPDLHDFTAWLFNGTREPLLGKDEVFCSLYDNGKVDIMRAPHLYREHGIKTNVVDNKRKEWFKTNAIYISNYSALSRLIQCDFDGDKVMVTQSSKFVEIAEQNMKNDDIVPLYYEMGKANPVKITGDNILKSLKKAYGENIGVISNQISKVWNTNDNLFILEWLTMKPLPTYIDSIIKVDNGRLVLNNGVSDDVIQKNIYKIENERVFKVNLRVLRYLCMENNFSIDFAKTGDKPTRPPKIDKEIKKYTKMKLPHLFFYAKDKAEDKVGAVNKSVVNRLQDIIPKKNIYFKKVVPDFDYRMLMSQPKVNLNKKITERYEELDKGKWKTIKELKGNEEIENGKKLNVYKFIRDELLKINDDPYRVADVLIKYLYNKKNSKYKTTLWESFGKEIVINLKRNLRKTKECAGCGTRIEKKNAKKYCDKCATKRKKASGRKTKAV